MDAYVSSWRFCDITRGVRHVGKIPEPNVPVRDDCKGTANSAFVPGLGDSRCWPEPRNQRRSAFTCLAARADRLRAARLCKLGAALVED